MGCYVNPQGMTKEKWLKANAESESVMDVPDFVPDDCLIVCLVDNGPFTAAAVGYSERELEYFKSPNDLRPKKWYVVQKVKLVSVLNPSDLHYII